MKISWYKTSQPNRNTKEENHRLLTNYYKNYYKRLTTGPCSITKDRLLQPYNSYSDLLNFIAKLPNEEQSKI